MMGKLSGKSHGVALVGIMASAFFLRFFKLESCSLWWDEILVPLNGQYGIRLAIERALHCDFHPPFFYILNYFVLMVGSSDLALRLIPAVCGLLSVYVFSRYSARYFNERVGLLAAAFLGCSLLHVFVSRSDRPYAIIVLLAIVSFFRLISYLKGGQFSDLVVAIVCDFFAALLHFSCVLLVLSHALIFFGWKIHERKRLTQKEIVLFSLFGAAALAAIGPFLFSHTDGLAPVEKASMLATFIEGLKNVANGLGPATMFPKELPFANNLFLNLGILLLVCLGGVRLYATDRLVCGSIIVYVLTPLVVLALARYSAYFNPWHVLFISPALLLLAAMGAEKVLAAIFKNGPLLAAAAGVLSVAGAVLVWNGNAAVLSETVRPGDAYKTLARNTARFAAPDRIKIFSDPNVSACIGWYARHYQAGDVLHDFALPAGNTVPFDFISFGDFGHYAKSEEEFLKMMDAPVTVQTVSIAPYPQFSIYSFALHRRSPIVLDRQEVMTFSTLPQALLRDAAAVKEIAFYPFFQKGVFSYDVAKTGAVTYEFVSDPGQEPSLLLGTVGIVNTGKGNRLRCLYSTDDGPFRVCLDSIGPDARTNLKFLIKPDVPFARLRLRFELSCPFPTAGMTGLFFPALQLTGFTLFATDAATEQFLSDSLIVRSDLEAREHDGGQTYIWGLGPHSTFAFALDADAAVAVDYDLNNPIPGQSVFFVLNGEPIHAITDLPAQKWLGQSTAGTIHARGRRGPNTLEIRYLQWNNQAGNAAATFAPGDGRTLAMVFKKLLITRQPAGAARPVLSE
ncbi:glycosyltransferase family 39 protein [Solidesulfovibrio sp.]